jgi:ABC transporter with metal-binding/Fe-S-binding domain ATP-binding protein
MRLASLFTGGKDSVYATHLAAGTGETVTHLVSMRPRRPDSWMFHSVNLHLAPLSAEALGIPLVQAETSGEKEEEMKDLKGVLSRLSVDGIVSGAIASTYQRSRIERICQELGITSITPLWGREPAQLLDEMINSGMVILITAVAALGLDESWLGRTLNHAALKELVDLSRRYGINVCGDGGEMETLVLDAPFFRKRLRILRTEKSWEADSGSLFVEAELVEKRL